MASEREEEGIDIKYEGVVAHFEFIPEEIVGSEYVSGYDWAINLDLEVGSAWMAIEGSMSEPVEDWNLFSVTVFEPKKWWILWNKPAKWVLHMENIEYTLKDVRDSEILSVVEEIMNTPKMARFINRLPRRK